MPDLVDAVDGSARQHRSRVAVASLAEPVDQGDEAAERIVVAEGHGGRSGIEQTTVPVRVVEERDRCRIGDVAGQEPER